MSITALTITAGVPHHIVVANSGAGHAPIDNSFLSWGTFDAEGTGLSFTADLAVVGGWFVNATSPGAATGICTYHNGGVTAIGPSLTVTVTSPVALEYLDT